MSSEACSFMPPFNLLLAKGCSSLNMTCMFKNTRDIKFIQETPEGSFSAGCPGQSLLSSASPSWRVWGQSLEWSNAGERCGGRLMDLECIWFRCSCVGEEPLSGVDVVVVSCLVAWSRVRYLGWKKAQLQYLETFYLFIMHGALLVFLSKWHSVRRAKPSVFFWLQVGSTGDRKKY